MIKANTHIGKQRQLLQSNKEQVCELLHWSEQEYCQYHFDQYSAFVERLSEDWPVLKQQLFSSAAFRGFWNLETACRETEDFLPWAQDCDDYSYLLSEYEFINDHKRLIQDEDFMNRFNGILDLIRYV